MRLLNGTRSKKCAGVVAAKQGTVIQHLLLIASHPTRLLLLASGRDPSMIIIQCNHMAAWLRMKQKVKQIAGSRRPAAHALP